MRTGSTQWKADARENGQEPSWKRVTPVAGLMSLLALLAVRIAALAMNRTDLFFDEAQYWAWAQEPAFGY